MLDFGLAKALASYREHGGVELSFDDIKNVLDLNRLRCHNGQTVRGKVFVNFIALIILSRLRKTVDAVKPRDRQYMSEMDMLDRIETYIRIHFSGKYNDVYTAPTKAQRTIFDLLGIKYEYKGEGLNAAESIAAGLHLSKYPGRVVTNARDFRLLRNFGPSAMFMSWTPSRK